jgi:hypothetical protein
MSSTDAIEIIPESSEQDVATRKKLNDLEHEIHALRLKNFDLEAEVKAVHDSRSLEKQSEKKFGIDASSTREVETKALPLEEGDLVWFRQEDESQNGTVLGNCSLKTVGVQVDDVLPPLRFTDGLFRLCSRLHYRSKTEVSRIIKVANQSDNQAVARKELNLEFEEQRMAAESAENAKLLTRLVHSDSPQELIRYGDGVQRQHVNSGMFLAVHKTPAPLEPNCRKVSLKPGSLAAHLKILPKYKVRSLGSIVHADDQIVLQSVKYDYCIGASAAEAGHRDSSNDGEDGNRNTLKARLSSSVKQGVKAVPSLNLRVPALLRWDPSAEVNASMEIRSFAVKFYHRPSANRGSLLTVRARLNHQVYCANDAFSPVVHLHFFFSTTPPYHAGPALVQAFPCRITLLRAGFGQP